MLRPNAVELDILRVLRELGEANVIEVGSETGLGSTKASRLCRHLTMHDYLQRQGVGYVLTPAGQRVLEVYGKETNPQAGNLPLREKKSSSRGENQVLGGSKVRASNPGRQRGTHSRKGLREAMKVYLQKGGLRPTAKAAILVHERGELQPPGSTRALASHRTRVLLAGSAIVLPPGNMMILPPGCVTIPLVSGVVAFH